MCLCIILICCYCNFLLSFKPTFTNCYQKFNKLRYIKFCLHKSASLLFSDACFSLHLYDALAAFIPTSSLMEISNLSIF